MKPENSPKTEQELLEKVNHHLLLGLVIGGITLSATKDTKDAEIALKPISEMIINEVKKYLVSNTTDFMKEVSNEK